MGDAGVWGVCVGGVGGGEGVQSTPGRLKSTAIQMCLSVVVRVRNV